MTLVVGKQMKNGRSDKKNKKFMTDFLILDDKRCFVNFISVVFMYLIWFRLIYRLTRCPTYDRPRTDATGRSSVFKMI